MKKIVIIALLLVASVQLAQAQIVTGTGFYIEQAPAPPPPKTLTNKSNLIAIDLGIANGTLIPWYDSEVSCSTPINAQLEYRRTWGKHKEGARSGLIYGINTGLSIGSHSANYTDERFECEFSSIGLKLGGFVGSRTFLGEKKHFDFTFGLTYGYGSSYSFEDDYCHERYEDEYADFKDDVSSSFLMGFDMRFIWNIKGFTCGIAGDLYILDCVGNSGLKLVVGYSW